MSEIKVFKTSDVVLAACLKSDHVPMIAIHRAGSKSIFEFNLSDPDDQKLLDDCNCGRFRVEPFEFYSTVRTLIGSSRNNLY